tara:strand:- start:932 stop:1699 length:768 start_codon:yes stop_codon:yes gene_type:complete
MYRDPRQTKPMPKPSERVGSKRTKYKASSGKELGQSALMDIPDRIKPKPKPSTPLDAVNGYRMSLAQMSKASPRSVSEGSIVEEDGTEYSYPAKAKGMLSEEAIAKVNSMAEKYGISANDFYRIFQGESAMDTTAQSKSTKAVGLPQFMPLQFEKDGVFDKLNKDITKEDVLKMSDVEQLGLYEDYLDYWKYDGSVPLAILQAAPGKIDKIKQNPDTVLYKKNSAAWDKNPGWRSDGDGDITGRSVMEYFEKVNR